MYRFLLLIEITAVYCLLKNSKELAARLPVSYCKINCLTVGEIYSWGLFLQIQHNAVSTFKVYIYIYIYIYI